MKRSLSAAEGGWYYCDVEEEGRNLETYVAMRRDDAHVNLADGAERASLLAEMISTLERLWSGVLAECGEDPEFENDVCRARITLYVMRSGMYEDSLYSIYTEPRRIREIGGVQDEMPLIESELLRLLQLQCRQQSQSSQSSQSSHPSSSTSSHSSSSGSHSSITGRNIVICRRVCVRIERYLTPVA
jgi:hypothetical protein